MGVFTQAVRNISKKVRALLVISAQNSSVAILTTTSTGVMANQKAAEQSTANSGNYLTIETEITAATTLLDPHLSPRFAGVECGKLV